MCPCLEQIDIIFNFQQNDNLSFFLCTWWDRNIHQSIILVCGTLLLVVPAQKRPQVTHRMHSRFIYVYIYHTCEYLNTVATMVTIINLSLQHFNIYCWFLLIMVSTTKIKHPVCCVFAEIRDRKSGQSQNPKTGSGFWDTGHRIFNLNFMLHIGVY